MNLTKLLKFLPFVALTAIIIYLFPHYNNSFAYYFEIGKPWGYELLTASQDFPIYKTDSELATEREEVLSDFAPCFVYTSMQTSPIVMSFEEMENLWQQDYQFISILDNQMSKRYPLSQVYTPKTAFEALGQEFSPNIEFDSLTTQQLKASILASISPTQGMVQQGEKIIDKGEVVTERTYQILQSLKRTTQETSVSYYQQLWHKVGLALIIILIVTIFVVYLFTTEPHIFEHWNTVLYCCILPLLLIATTFCFFRYAYIPLLLVPFVIVPVVTRVFFDSRVAFILHLFTILIVALAVSVPLEFVAIQSLAGITAVVSLHDLGRRSHVAIATGFVVLTYALSYTAFCLFSPLNYHAIEWLNYVYISLNGILVLAFSYVLIMGFEQFFGFTSATTLIELTNVNSSIFQEFAEKAPGSFQHSLQVGNLASEAAKRIGANALLTRTGALYHDIGKMLHPEYFIENQGGGRNPLNEMDPREAARIVIAHVEDGVTLAKKHRLPLLIIRFIRSHHGTSLTRYFYNTYANAHPNEQVAVEQFQYPGPKPTTKEGAILMMADAIEARSRSLPAYTEQTISTMIKEMMDQQVAENQFSDTPLSFKDLEDVRQVFTERLLSIYHHRIAYPKLDTQNNKQ